MKVAMCEARARLSFEGGYYDAGDRFECRLAQAVGLGTAVEILSTRDAVEPEPMPLAVAPRAYARPPQDRMQRVRRTRSESA
jgi:hypothetical protein